MIARSALPRLCRAGLVIVLSVWASSSSAEAFRVLKTFQNLGCPSSDTVRDPEGHLYLTTSCGGSFGRGALLKLSPGGKLTVLHSFAGGADGSNPVGLLFRDASGNLYGSTLEGGVPDVGTIYKLGRDGSYSVLHSFQGTDGSHPNGGLFRDPSGSLYGTALTGGPSGVGTAFKLAPDGTLTVLHSFDLADDEGFYPTCCLVPDAKGNLYGTTASGGLGGGTVFKLAPDGTVTVLHSFTGGDDGAQPSGLLRSGNTLYGSTGSGGAGHGGTIFKLTADGTFTVLYSFIGLSGGGLSRDGSGNLYGVIPQGGFLARGAIFRLAPDGTFALVYEFKGEDDGNSPTSPLVLDAAGNLYGVASSGGAGAYGTVFKVAPDGSFTLLRSLSLLSPNGGLALDASGNIFGTTQRGGDSGYGSVFELSRTDRSYVDIHSFHGIDGLTPVGDLLLGETGELYGTSLGGGEFSRGTAFKLGTDGTYTVLHGFGGPVPGDGLMPVAGLAADGNGNLYGTTPQGGPIGGGTLFKLEANGGYTVLHGFSFGPGDGTIPLAGVVADGSGNLFGTTSQGGAFGVGVVFRFASDGTYSLLHNFTGSDGSKPLGALILDSSGNLFGTTSAGGASGLGNLFKLAPDGTFTSLHDFAQAEGATPKAGLVLDVDGSLYGTTSRGGSSDRGTVFKLAPDETYTLLHSFTGKDGAFPVGGLRFYDGILFGTTSAGGPLAGGSVFLIRP